MFTIDRYGGLVDTWTTGGVAVYMTLAIYRSDNFQLVRNRVLIRHRTLLYTR